MKKQSVPLSMLAAVAAAALMVYGWFQLGPLVMMLFMATMAICIMDALFGKVKLVMFIPCLFLPFISIIGSLVFAWVLCHTLVIWIFCGIINSSWLAKKLKLTVLGMATLQKYTTFGFGDVLGLPLVFALAEIMFPHWGIPVMAAGLLAETPLLIKRSWKLQNIRLLAWFALPLMAVYIVAVFS
jgi:hypothetical protein